MSEVTRDAYIDAAAALVGLSVAPEDRAEVARFLGLAADMAAVVARVDLDDAELALAPVFRLPAPQERLHD